MSALLSSAREANDAALVHTVELPLGDRFFGADHSREHDADGKDQFNLPPDDMHMIADHLALRDFAHVKRHSLTHATPAFDSFPGPPNRVSETLPEGERLTLVNITARVSPVPVRTGGPIPRPGTGPLSPSPPGN